MNSSRAPSGAAGSGAASPLGSPVTVTLSAFPNKPGVHYVMLHTDHPTGKPASTWMEEYYLERVDGDLFTLVTENKNTGTHRPYYVVRHQDGIYLMPSEPPWNKNTHQHETSGGSLVFKLPMKPGLEWQFKTPNGGVARRKVEGEDVVTVPAGTFRAVRLIDEREDAVGKLWFVPGIGLVKGDLTGSDGRFVKELSHIDEAPH